MNAQEIREKATEMMQQAVEADRERAEKTPGAPRLQERLKRTEAGLRALPLIPHEEWFTSTLTFWASQLHDAEYAKLGAFNKLREVLTPESYGEWLARHRYPRTTQTDVPTRAAALLGEIEQAFGFVPDATRDFYSK